MISIQVSVVVPDLMARKAAIWIVIPSALGSEKGIPNSSASAPASMSVLITSKDCSAFGSPIVTKGIKANEMIKFKEISYINLAKELGIDISKYPNFVITQIETISKYDIFIKREEEQIKKFKRLEGISIPKNFNFKDIKGISNIAKSGLEDVKPLSIGEASRISGVTGNDIAILLGNIK